MSSKIKLVPATAKIIVVKKENPFTHGTAVYKRVQAVLLGNGKTKAAVIRAGAKSSTVRWALNEGRIRIQKAA